MHEEISSVTVLTIVISTVLLVILAGVIIFFLFAYQKKIYRHEQDLLKSKVLVQEQTLDKVGKEIHSNISQLVSVINMNLAAHLQQNPSADNENIIETKALVKQLMLEIKGLSVALNTEHVSKVGFVAMLESELERLTRTGFYSVAFNKSGMKYRLESFKEIVLFRLCQEVLNNIIKHAGAKSISVHIDYSVSRLQVVIHDDGTGFLLQEVIERSGEMGSTGINNIFNRTKQIDGTVLIDTAPGNGTLIKITIPKQQDVT